MVREVLTHLKAKKVNIYETSLPKSLKQHEGGKIAVEIQNQKTK